MSYKSIARTQIIATLRTCEVGISTIPATVPGTLKMVYGMMLMARSCNHITYASALRISDIIDSLEGRALAEEMKLL